MASKGIFLVANLKSQDLCENLIFSIRESGCTLPIRLIHFGGKEVCSSYVLEQVELLYLEDFPIEAQEFVKDLRSVLTSCPLGFLYRFLGWFSDWDEFIYSDNDVVALCNWEKLFTYLPGYNIVHADQEYITDGVHNYFFPQKIEEIFGQGSLQTLITAGHIVVKKNQQMVVDMRNAIAWFKEHHTIPKKHDQALLHIASLLGQWKVLNLCKPPHNWLSSWAGDYQNTLDIILKSKCNEQNISHLHYSGYVPDGSLPIQELIFSNANAKERLRKIFILAIKQYSGLEYMQFQKKRIERRIRRIVRRN